MEECVAASRADGPEGGGVACKIRSRGVAGVHVLQAGSPEPGVHPILKELLLDPAEHPGTKEAVHAAPLAHPGWGWRPDVSAHVYGPRCLPPLPSEPGGAKNTRVFPASSLEGPPLPPQQPLVGSWTP